MKLPEVNSKRWLDLEPISHEIWRFLHHAENESNYYASNMGRIKVVHKSGREKILVQRKNSSGYYRVRVDDCFFFVHRLVAIAFIRKAFGWKFEVDHRNNIKTDNRARNLRWVTRTKNANNPVSRWEKDNNRGLAVGERPNPGKTSNFLSEEESLAVVNKRISKVIEKRKAARL